MKNDAAQIFRDARMTDNTKLTAKNKNEARKEMMAFLAEHPKFEEYQRLREQLDLYGAEPA